MMKRRRIMVCTAHPDDEVFCAGTILRLVDAGNDVHLVIGTQGEKGSHDPNLTPQLIAQTRKQEMDLAAHRLGLAGVVQLEYRDGELQYASDLKETLFGLVRSLRPDVVITFDPWKRYEVHSDHRVIGFAMIEAAHLSANCWYYHDQLQDSDTTCHRSDELYLFNCDEPNYHVDITRVFERKLLATAAHKSQFGDQVDEYRLREILNERNPDAQMTLESFHKMWHSDLYL